MRYRPRATGPLLVLAIALGLIACTDVNSARGIPATEGVVTRVISTTGGGPFGPLQRVEVYVTSTGVTELLDWGTADQPITYNSLLREGDHVLLTRPFNARAEEPHRIADVVRLPLLLWLGGALAIALFLVARWQGLASLAGLVLSAVAFFSVVIPAIDRGVDPLVATLGVSIVVLGVSVYLVHGLNRKSSVALGGAVGGLAVVAVLALAVVAAGRISGVAGQALAVAQFAGLRGQVDLPRLALAAMILGGLGALIDMAVGQSSTTFEMAAADPDLAGWDLYRRALNVGRDHIGALVNTLGFAYFAGALPLLVLLVARGDALSLALNDEGTVLALADVGVASLGLIACVPLTTGLAAWTIRRTSSRSSGSSAGSSGRARRSRARRGPPGTRDAARPT